jgi:hypothetical protein
VRDRLTRHRAHDHLSATKDPLESLRGPSESSFGSETVISRQRNLWITPL